MVQAMNISGQLGAFCGYRKPLERTRLGRKTEANLTDAALDPDAVLFLEETVMPPV